jgi:MFS family permease
MKTQLQARHKAGRAGSSRLDALRRPDFRRFFIGFTTSELGTAMSATATTFAILDSGKSAADLGYVMAAGIVPIVLCLLGGGVFADRIGSRRVMLGADCVRCLAQTALAIALFTTRPPLWVFIVLVMVRSAGEGFFTPALSALTPQLLGGGNTTDANALMKMAGSSADVAGPALSGILVAFLGPAAVVALDAASYLVSIFTLWSIRVANPAPASRDRRSVFADLREGWTEFRSRAWIWVTTLQFGLFNLLVWAPFLVLGPVVAHQRYGGAKAWGLTMACYGAGSILGGIAMLGRRPRRPMIVATIATFGYACPSIALGLSAPVVGTAVAVFVAGIGSTVCNTLYSATSQQLLPPTVLARVNSYSTLGSFVLGPLGLAAAGPVALAIGIPRVLLFGAMWQVCASAVVLCLPTIRIVSAPSSPSPSPVVASAAASPDSPLVAVESLGEGG